MTQVVTNEFISFCSIECKILAFSQILATNGQGKISAVHDEHSFMYQFPNGIEQPVTLPFALNLILYLCTCHSTTLVLLGLQYFGFSQLGTPALQQRSDIFPIGRVLLSIGW